MKILSDEDHKWLNPMIFIVVMLFAVFFVGGMVMVYNWTESYVNGSPDIIQINDSTYQWQAKWCARGVYATLDKDVIRFKKEHPSLRVKDVSITERKGDYKAPWRAVITAEKTKAETWK